MGFPSQPVLIWGKISDSVSRGVRVDSSTHAINTIKYEHHKIHDGCSFTSWYEQTVSDINDKTIIAFKTPNTTKYLHLIPTASSTLVAEAYILEAPTITDNQGTTLTVFNRRRVGTPTASTVIDTSQNPDAAGSAMYFSEADMGEVTSGTELAHIHLATGEGKKAVGGRGTARDEWILKPNTLYAFVVNSLTNDDNVCLIELNWYEHEDKN